MAAPEFAHLHLHTEYSMLDGSVRVSDLMAKVSELGMPAVAMTDHGVLYGAVEFYKEARKAGIKAIIQPGGSIADADVIKETDKAAIAMVARQRPI